MRHRQIWREGRDHLHPLAPLGNTSITVIAHIGARFARMPRDAVKAPIAALRQQLADEILRLIDDFPTVISAQLLCIDERRMADLRHGRVQRFSVERLIRMLAQIHRRVDLTVVNTGPPMLQWLTILKERKRNFRPG